MRKSYSRALSLLLAVLMLIGQMVFVSTAAGDTSLECTCEDRDNKTANDGVFNREFAGNCGYYGYDEYTCNDCGGYFVILTTPPTGDHTYNVPAADCENNKECTTCGIVFEDNLGHDFSVEVPAKAADCTTSGWNDHLKCSRCDETEGKKTEKKLGHDYSIIISIDEIQKCYDKGSETVQCAREGCGNVTTRDIPAYKCHVNYVATRIEPTCTENAKVFHDCNACDFEGFYEILEGEGNEATGHDCDMFDAKAATCTEIGWDAYAVCKVDGCGYNTYVEIPALGHELGDVETLEATCGAGGYDYQACTREGCDYVYVIPGTETEQRHDAHVKIRDGRKDPTCVDKGYTGDMVCSVCGTLLSKGEDIPELGHNMTDVAKQKANCLQVGWDKHQACTREGCDYKIGYKEYEKTACVKGEDGKTLGTVLPTCTEQGYDIEQCIVCKKTFRDNFKEALGHEMDVEVEALAATCLTDGWEAHMACSNKGCDYHDYGENDVLYIKALGHDIVKVEDTDPTCEEAGFKAHEYCQRENCDYTTRDYSLDTPALGHTPDVRDVVETEAQVGYTETYCTVCGKSLDKDYVDDEVYFSYEATGINGVDTAVNSGEITVKVYANVESAYARIWGVNIALKYNDALTFIKDKSAGNLFRTFNANSYVNDNEENVVMFVTNNGLTEGTKVFANGKHLVATLTFKVAGDFYKADAVFEVIADDCAYTRETTIENDYVVDFGTGVAINVAMLGDAVSADSDRPDGKINVNDARALYEWFLNNDDDAYNYVFDMDKDGFITGDDFALLEGAIVHNDAYLEI